MIEVASIRMLLGIARVGRRRANQLGIAHGRAERIDQVMADRRRKMSQIVVPISVLGSFPAREVMIRHRRD